MPVYEYEGLSSTGSVMQDIITADTPRDARERLRRRGLHVTRIDVAKELNREKQSSVILETFSSRRARAELVMVTQQFATLLKAGIPLSNALTALIDQIENKRLGTVFRDLSERVQGGSSLADAMEHHPKIFSSLYINMVKTGEASGTLDIVLQRLSDFMRRRDRISKRVMGALTYPFILMAVGMVIFLVLMAFVVPNISQLLKKQGMELMWLTQFYMWVSEMILNWWPVMTMATITVLLILWRWFWHSDKGRRQKDFVFMRIPVIGRLVKKNAVARFTSTFAILLEAGIPALDALLIVRDVIGNVWLSDIINEVREKVSEGADIATPIKQSGLFPPTVGYMIAVGEESGQLEEMLRTISDAYEDEVDIEAQKLTSILEPFMIVVLAVIVASIVVSILIPMMKLTQGVNAKG